VNKNEYLDLIESISEKKRNAFKLSKSNDVKTLVDLVVSDPSFQRKCRDLIKDSRDNKLNDFSRGLGEIITLVVLSFSEKS